MATKVGINGSGRIDRLALKAALERKKDVETGAVNDLADVKAVPRDLEEKSITVRIWRKDHTVWKPDPREIGERMGWLTITDWIQEQLPHLDSFSDEIRQAGFGHIVLLGMGGSGLGVETLRQIFGCATGYPETIVIDSTVPSVVRAVPETIEPENTLFVVSSKSGTTTETLCLFKYFLMLVKSASGKDSVGENFVVIRAPGTPLAVLGEEQGFRRIFLNPSDIGGRSSVCWLMPRLWEIWRRYDRQAGTLRGSVLCGMMPQLS